MNRSADTMQAQTERKPKAKREEPKPEHTQEKPLNLYGRKPEDVLRRMMSMPPPLRKK